MLEETAEDMIVPVREIALGTDPGEFERGLDAALAARPRALVLEMGAVARVSSTIVAMVLWARRRCVTEGVEIVLRHPSRRCRETLDRAGLRQLVREAGGLPAASVHRRTSTHGGG